MPSAPNAGRAAFESSTGWRLDPFSGMVFVFRAKPTDHVDESGRNKTE